MIKINLIRKEEQEQLERLRCIEKWRDSLCPHKERLRLINEINAKYGLLTKRLTKKPKGEPYNLCDTGFSFQPLN